MRKLFTLIAIASVFASCEKDVLEGGGDTITSARDVANFSGVDIAGANKVFISYGPETTVNLKGYSNLIPHYETEVSNGVLHLHYKETVNVKNDNLEVYITMPSFDALRLSGSCAINALGDFENTDELSVSTSGDGTVSIGDITADLYTISSSGSSEISTLGVKAKTAFIEISGSSSISLSVSEKLDVQISGSGTVSYKGDPSDVTTDISGSGKVIKL